MGLFDLFKKAKKEPYPVYLETGAYNMPKWSSNKDEAYLREGYNKVVWVYACVAKIASCVSSVPWELYRVNKTNGKETEILEHPILNMLNYNINPSMTSKDFFDLWATYLATQGKFYALFNNAGLPTQIFPLYPHDTRPIPDRVRFINGFEYQVSGSQVRYDTQEILWSKFNDPLDLYEGLSPIKAVARTIDTENEAVDWNKSQLQNQAVPPGAIQVQNPSPEMQNKLRTEWLKRYSGAKNARVPLVLNAEKANYIPFGLDSIDMDFINQRKLNRIEICAAFGVPSQVVGDPEGQTYANYNEAVKSLWNETIIPKYLEHIKDILNLYIANKYADNLVIKYNLDNIGALHESMDSLADRAVKLYKGEILTLNEARAMINYDDIEDGDERYEPFEMPEKEKEPEKEEESKKKSLNLTEEQKEMFWKKQDEEKEKYIKATTTQFEKAFEKENELIQILLRNIDKNSEIYDTVQKVIKSQSKDKQKILVALYNLVIGDFGTQSYNRLRRGDTEFDSYAEDITKYIKAQTAKQVTQINDTTLTQLKKRIDFGINEGQSVAKIASSIKDLYKDDITPNRSKMIAQTETISASNYGSLSGAEQAQEEYNLDLKKVWIRTYDSRVRDTHIQAGNHKPIALNEKFQVGDSKLKYPGDFGGSAKEVVNCRCAIAYESD